MRFYAKFFSCSSSPECRKHGGRFLAIIAGDVPLEELVFRLVRYNSHGPPQHDGFECENSLGILGDAVF